MGQDLMGMFLLRVTLASGHVFLPATCNSCGGTGHTSLAVTARSTRVRLLFLWDSCVLNHAQTLPPSTYLCHVQTSALLTIAPPALPTI